MCLNIRTERTSCDMAKVFDYVNNDESEYVVKQLGNNWELGTFSEYTVKYID
jgi:hypothetical protein